MNDKNFAAELRQVADDIEQGKNQCFVEMFVHYHETRIPFEKLYLGKSLVMHFGAANDSMLVDRLMKKSNSSFALSPPMAVDNLDEGLPTIDAKTARAAVKQVVLGQHLKTILEHIDKVSKEGRSQISTLDDDFPGKQFWLDGGPRVEMAEEELRQLGFDCNRYIVAHKHAGSRPNLHRDLEMRIIW